MTYLRTLSRHFSRKIQTMRITKYCKEEKYVKDNLIEYWVKIVEVENRYQYKMSENGELYQFIQDSLDGELSKKTYHKLSSSISDRLANDIEKIVGFSVQGYSNEISSEHVRHIQNRHGPNGKSDHSMQDLHDVARIGYVVDHHDKIIEGDLNHEYKNRDNSFSRNVILQKKIEDNYFYVVEAVPDTVRKTLHVVSAYINKNDTFPVVSDTKSLDSNVQNELQSNMSSNNSISQKHKNAIVDYSVELNFATLFLTLLEVDSKPPAPHLNPRDAYQLP